MKKYWILSSFFMVLWACQVNGQSSMTLKVHAGQHFFQDAKGKPFFWLGDTGWLLWVKCNREAVQHYLDVRKSQGFNVIQVMGLHELKSAKNAYGDSALIHRDVSKLRITPGNDPADTMSYDYWDHVEFVIKEAAKRGMYIGYVPVWGSNVKEGLVSVAQATVYANFLADRFGAYDNIIWLVGGDVKGTDGEAVWNAIGSILHEKLPSALITYHPRGRYSSADFFHQKNWLSFNMIQSGHRNYAQDTSAADLHHFGEDSWRYMQQDWSILPTKPTMDGEPSYENIPQGLHDYSKPLWNADDIRRYVYWSVFAGGAGVTYGENSVMQFHTPGDADANYDVKLPWKKALYAKGAQQMKYLKKLMLSNSYFDRTPAQEILWKNKGTRYEYQLATKGKSFAYVYAYTGNDIHIDFSKLGFTVSKAFWFKPATGIKTLVKGKINFHGQQIFDPPGKSANGNDWVLILEK